MKERFLKKISTNDFIRRKKKFLATMLATIILLGDKSSFSYPSVFAKENLLKSGDEKQSIVDILDDNNTTSSNAIMEAANDTTVDDISKYCSFNLTDKQNDESKSKEYVISNDKLDVRVLPNIESELDGVVYAGQVVKDAQEDEFEDDNYIWKKIKYTGLFDLEDHEGWIVKTDKAKSDMNNLSEGNTEDLLKDNIIGESVLAMDADTNEILFEKNSRQLMSPASITKIMTIHLASKYGNLEDLITFSDDAINLSIDGEPINDPAYNVKRDIDLKYIHQYINYLEKKISYPPVRLGDIVSAGKEISLKDAMYMALLQSVNEATYAIGEYLEKKTGKSIADLMNEEARLMGCENSHFTNSFGFDGGNEETKHLITAEDMAKILAYILKNDPTTLEIMGTNHYNLEYDGRVITHISWFLKESCPKPGDFDFKNKNVIASKTGTTDKAGKSIVNIFEKDGKRIVVVVLKSNSDDNKCLDTLKVANYAYEKIKQENTKEIEKVLVKK